MAFGRRRKEAPQDEATAASASADGQQAGPIATITERPADGRAAGADGESPRTAVPPIEPVHGGTLRRIVFEGDGRSAPASDDGANEPTESPPSGAVDLVGGGATRHVAWSSGSGSYSSTYSSTYTPGLSYAPSHASERFVTRTLYETPRGAVRESRWGDQRALTLSRSGDSDVRFLHSMVDRVIADVRLEEFVEERAAPTRAAAAEPVAEYRRVVTARGTSVQEVVRESRDLRGDEPWSPPTSAPQTAAMLEPPAAKSKPAKAAPDKPAKMAPAKPATYLDYPGDNHLVIDVEGVGKEYARRLQKVGVHTTGRLCYEDPEDLAARLDVAPSMVTSWQAMAQLMKVKGIGAQYAEVLVRSGIASIDELRRLSPEKASERVTRYLATLDNNPIGHALTPARVKPLIQAAKKMRRVRLDVPELGAPSTSTVGGGREVVEPVKAAKRRLSLPGRRRAGRAA